MASMFPITREDVLIELERELGVRESVYPRWVNEKRSMTQDMADHRIACIAVAIEMLKETKR